MTTRLLTTTSGRDRARHQGTVWFVSRHPGALEWARRQGVPLDRHVAHLNIDQIDRDDIVIGTLPVQMIHLVNQKGASYGHLSLDIPACLRGKELSADELVRCNARIESYHVVQEDV